MLLYFLVYQFFHNYCPFTSVFPFIYDIVYSINIMNTFDNTITVGIVGAGAMGSLFAFLLHPYATVVMYETNKSTVNDIKKNGLSIEYNTQTHAINPMISNNPGILAHADCIFIFVKSFATKSAIEAIKPYIKSDAIIITLQNGIGNVPVIQSMTTNPLVYGTTTIGATRLTAAKVRFGGEGQIIIGGDSYRHNSFLYSLLQKAGLQVTITQNPDKALWEKAIVNAAINPLGAILEVPNGALLYHDYIKDIMRNIIMEAADVGLAQGIDIRGNDMIITTFQVCTNTKNNYCSMLQDISAKRITEIDYINGAIIKTAMHYGIATPYNATVYRLVKYKELLL